MASKDERERAALAARAAARAQLSAAGQVLPQAYGAMPSGGGGGGGAGLTEQTRSLLAACKAAGLDTSGRPSAGASSSSSSSSSGGGGWAQAPQGFYFHPASGVAQWAAPPAAGAQRAAPPAPLPQGWFLADSAEGPYYYTASFTNARGVVGQLRTWERPSAPPATGALTAGM